jgi:hypothetical protein
MSNEINFTTASPSHDAAMKRYEEELAACSDFDPPLTVEERKRILDACLTGSTIMLRCKFYKDEKPEIVFTDSPSGDQQP